jgi:voltage-gated potassium channel
MKALRRSALISALIIALYYVVPVESGVPGGPFALRVAGTVVAGLAITVLIVRQVTRHVATPEEASLPGLLTALVGGVVFFAFVDYNVAIIGHGQFADLSTRTDALYFALATLSTVGYGDVHATGQVARAVVAAQLVFNLVVVATGATVLTRSITARVRARHQP